MSTELDLRMTMHSMVFSTPGPMTTTSLGTNQTTTIRPGGETKNRDLSWIPYAIAGTAAVAFVILLFFCFCKSLRNIFGCPCFVRKRHNNTLTNPSVSPGSSYVSGYAPSTASGIKNITSAGSSVRRNVSSQGGSAATPPHLSASSVQTIHTYGPTIKTSSVQPTKSSLRSGAKTQKYIGTILSTSRKSRPSVTGIRPVPSKAPSAAGRVAKTQTIIGNILTHGGSNKRKSST